jgi:hypothetical protein
MQSRTAECDQPAGTGAWLAKVRSPGFGSGIRSIGSVAGLGQHPAQVDNCLGVDVFVGGRVEVFGLGPDGHGNLSAVLLLG